MFLVNMYFYRSLLLFSCSGSCRVDEIGSIFFFNFHVEVPANCSFHTAGCTQIDEVANLVNRLTLNLKLNRIVYVERTLVAHLLTAMH